MTSATKTTMVMMMTTETVKAGLRPIKMRSRRRGRRRMRKRRRPRRISRRIRIMSSRSI